MLSDKMFLSLDSADEDQMIRERIAKIQDIKHSAELRKKTKEQEKAARVEIFTDLIHSIERCQTELLEMMEEQQKAAEKQDKDHIQELQQEIAELKLRSTELELLSHSKDHLHLLQTDASLCSLPHTRNWSEISMNTDVSVETLRRALTQLQETLDRKLRQTVFQRMQRYAVDVTLNPDTAHPSLTLSDDRKQVTHCAINPYLLNNPQRFDYCACVLGKEGFSSVRFYFEVDVRGSSEWDIGVARESINKKGQIVATPDNGYYAVALRNKNEYCAFADPLVPLSEREATDSGSVCGL
ncbi:hypothetical protein G5714_001129 [Onychostoma macrolepis]|uniref:B30.2/SPRY domain-containing protein n=1 Tax=Onychostoma macrolepis TaxID=369639 RepID=A0A7J6DIH9_9TELE|nr:hypothetical protein G5714_001129 [Onychostoma macrolepis]